MNAFEFILIVFSNPALEVIDRTEMLVDCLKKLNIINPTKR